MRQFLYIFSLSIFIDLHTLNHTFYCVTYTSISLMTKNKEMPSMYINLDETLLPESTRVYLVFNLINSYAGKNTWVHLFGEGINIHEPWSDCKWWWKQEITLHNLEEGQILKGYHISDYVYFSICLKLSRNRPFWIKNTNFDSIPSRLYLHTFILHCI